MSTKCLVTKLMSSVNNDDLLKIDELAIPVNAGSFYIVPSKSINVRSDKAALSLTSGGAGSKSIVVPAGTTASTPTTIYVAQSCVVYIPQYDILRLVIAPVANVDYRYIGTNSVRLILSLTNSNDLRYDFGTLPKSTFELVSGQYSFNLDWDNYPVLKSIQSMYGSVLNISLAELAEKAPLLQSLNLVLSAAQMGGSLDDLGKCKSITEAKGIARGTIEGFVTSERAAYGERAARTTGSAVISGSNITFQGTPVGSGNHNLSWTENTITLDGTTINA